ncbi:MAG: DUF2971 domain-containing protein [Desulfarculaceae bacterium]|nr:DUF2971 domain-containing protein [Desulfarculaceae bacterium]
MPGHVKRMHPGFNRKQRRGLAKTRIKERQYENVNPEHIYDSLKTRFNQHGILCLTEVPDNLLMWSHYGSSHEGVCLCFDCNNEFFGRANKVEYLDVCPTFTGPDTPDRELIKAIFYSKHSGWKYEKEWRIIQIQGGGKSHIFPSGALTDVYFGCRTKEKHKRMIVEWSQSMSQRPKLFEYHREKRVFGLELHSWGQMSGN